MPGRKGQLQGHAAMLLFSALIAGSFSLGVQVANEIAPAALNWIRFIIAGVVVGLVVAFGPGVRRAHMAAPWRYLVLGALFALYFVLMFEGLKSARPVSAAAVFTLTPIIAAIFGYILLGQIMTARMALGIAVGAVGAVWVIFRADPSALVAFDIGRGEAIYFIGCISHAAYTPMIRRLNRGEPASVMTLGMIAGGIVVLTAFGWRDIAATGWSELRGLVWATILYLAIFASAATFLLLQFATLRLPSAKVMAYTYLTPSWVVMWEMFQGNAPPPALVLSGVVLTVIALVLLLRDEEQPQRAR